MNTVGNRNHYYTWDDTPMPDGKYHVGEGGTWGWRLGKGFKTIAGAKRWAIKQAGTDTYKD